MINNEELRSRAKQQREIARGLCETARLVTAAARDTLRGMTPLAVAEVEAPAKPAAVLRIFDHSDCETESERYVVMLTGGCRVYFSDLGDEWDTPSEGDPEAIPESEFRVEGHGPIPWSLLAVELQEELASLYPAGVDPDPKKHPVFCY